MEAAAADGDPYVPIYISSDEEDGHAHAYFAESYSLEEIKIQEAILLSLDPSRATAAAAATASSSASPSSSRPTGVSSPREPPLDRKGKRQISSEDGSSDRKKKRSRRSRFNCAICFEMVKVSEKFVVSNCAHAFCNSCIGRYVAGKIAENVAVVGCPDPWCEEGVVEMDLCWDIVPPELFDRWNVALCENLLGDVKFYCPFKDCSALVINDGSVKIRETECPHCHRLFCARCRVPWHDGIKCKDFRKLGEDDLTLKRSRRNRFNCAICFEMVEVSEKFVVSNCAHAFCNSCIGRYVAGKIAENVAVVGCPDPGCEEGVVEMDLCRDIVPPELFDRWNVALCENLLGDVKFYCPFKDCSALVINDGSVKTRETECPHCHRLFCARCRVPWHDGIKCKDFRKLGDDEKGEDDLTLKKLADKKKWQRCPKCKMYVSRKSGCLLIKCR
ncbi:hypothetical protein BAE44_0007875 [Dichanthelium oligosanthes]|uniref:RBR-type E3 ubiquitin transferase n=1 Tax=Dichanthelium oligosanthes TaxID=888268 RepID=A0A1E5W141_9POAL|nr:hypothetical protein BAE44_0007875 [Dichanthelium oligosanthes]